MAVGVSLANQVRWRETERNDDSSWSLAVRLAYSVIHARLHVHQNVHDVTFPARCVARADSSWSSKNSEECVGVSCDWFQQRAKSPIINSILHLKLDLVFKRNEQQIETYLK